MDDSKVSCLLCPAIVPRGGKEVKNYNTTNMRCHLEINHKDEFATLIAKEKDKTSSTGTSSQPTIIDLLMKSQLFLFERHREKEITKKVGEMIAIDGEPFSIVHHTGFT